MSAGLQLILSAAMVAAPSGCSWAHPGANPYRSDPVRALADFDLPEATREKLRAMMAAHRYTDVATIGRDDIAGAHGYTDLRQMHSGHGQVCHGTVDRSAWSPEHRERGLVYCADDACVIVPTICNNVSLVSRKPDEVAALGDGPIDIEPAAGPPAAATPSATAAASDATPALDFFPATDIVGALPGTPAAPGGGGGAGGFPGAGNPIGSGPAGGGELGCCDVGPIGPTSPGSPGGPGTPGTPPISAVPEAPTWLMMLAAAACFVPRRRGLRR